MIVQFFIGIDFKVKSSRIADFLKFRISLQILHILPDGRDHAIDSRFHIVLKQADKKLEQPLCLPRFSHF